MHGEVVAVARCADHRFSKHSAEGIEIIAGLGVSGDAHSGATVKHRSRVRHDPTQPNLRQVHLIQAELFDELADQGFSVKPADLGENITTRGLELLSLPRGAILEIGAAVRVEVTGLRNPCAQIEAFQPGLLKAALVQGREGLVVRKSGVMAIALTSGAVGRGDRIRVVLPDPPFRPLERV